LTDVAGFFESGVALEVCVEPQDTMSKREEKYKYLVGFGNWHATEALPNSLPIGQNSPQVCARGLYAEQLSGSPFTAPRVDNVKAYELFFSKFCHATATHAYIFL
jgi:homogentisate 1,2-dioxygenase